MIKIVRSKSLGIVQDLSDSEAKNFTQGLPSAEYAGNESYTQEERHPTDFYLDGQFGEYLAL